LIHESHQFKNCIDTLTWKEVRDFTHRINPHLAAEFDKVIGIEQLPVLKVRYPFGATITDKGRFHLPINGRNIPWGSPDIPEKIRALLDYPWDTIPFGLVWSNSFESFIELPSHTVPLRLLTQGNMFSLFSIFEKNNRFLIPGLQSATAGARSLFVLPQIAHKQYNRRLTRWFQIPDDKANPKDYPHHWDLLKAIANSSRFRTPWHCELLLFTKPFMDRIEQYYRLKAFLLQNVWSGTSFIRSEAKYDMLWSVFTYQNLGASLRSPFALETAKHILKMIIKRVPGFAPARNDIAGPVSEFMNIFSNIYKIRYHLPIIMQPYTYDGVNPLYYSLHNYTLLQAFPEEKTHGQLIRELEDIRKIILTFIEQMNENKLSADLSETTLFEMLNNTEIDFFHSSGEGNIRKDVEDIPKEDDRFTEPLRGSMKRPDLEFPSSSSFFKGCIRVRPKQES
jgi:hypothetical protein